MRCVDHLRALLAMKTSRSSMADLLQGWDTYPLGIKCALHAASVVSYSRPFTSSKTNAGNITYPTRQLAKAVGFDAELHRHILDVRNQIVAHGDYGIFPSTIYMQSIGDERLPVALGINVKGMYGIASRDLALRYEKHIAICERRIEDILNQECSDLALEAKLHPEVFDGAHAIPEVREQLTPSDSGLVSLPRPSGPAGTVEEPAFVDGLSGYSYVTLTHQIALQENGEYEVTVDGTKRKIELSS